MLRRLLLDALVNADRSDRPADPEALVSDAARSATEWSGAEPEERAKTLRELLELADALRPSPAISFPSKITRLHGCLRGAGIPHAFGGALALAYYAEPRMTGDIDVNVFVPAPQWKAVYAALHPLGLEAEVDERHLKRDEEARLGWEHNSIHLFFSSDPLHEAMREGLREVPFDNTMIPIVAPEHLIVRKALLDRTKDWIDIEQILVATDPVDLPEIESWLDRMVGEGDPRMKKLGEVKAALSLD